MNNYTGNDVREYAEDVIFHHGILGQKWGVRRFQNKDGTLTNQGKKRYGDESNSETGTVSYRKFDSESGFSIPKKKFVVDKKLKNELKNKFDSDDDEIKTLKKDLKSLGKEMFKSTWLPSDGKIMPDKIRDRREDIKNRIERLCKTKLNTDSSARYKNVLDYDKTYDQYAYQVANYALSYVATDAKNLFQYSYRITEFPIKKD